MKYIIIIELKHCNKTGAKDIKYEIEDKMLPDYSDTIKSIMVFAKVVKNK